MAQVLQFGRLEAVAADPVQAAQEKQPFLGDILVRTGALAPDALDAALALQREQDTLLGRILIVNGLISRDALTEALSEQSKLGRIDLDVLPPDPMMAAEADPYLCLSLEAIPWRRFGGRRVIAIANPANGKAAMEALGGTDEPVALAIATPEAIRSAITRQFGAGMAAEAESRCDAAFSCRSIVSTGFTWTKATAIAAIAGAIALAPMLALQIALVWILASNLLTTGLRLVAIFARVRGGAPMTTSATPRLVEYKRLPSVSVLVPLKGEAAVAGQLLAAMGRMEYPAPLLDIKLVLEADDRATLAAIERAGMPPTVEVVIVPPGTIQTKPRAMNYALPFCRGEIVGVYDAEDLPDPGQIRAVVQHLMEAPREVACVQGYLDFYNTDRNWLSRCFTIEYAAWFRVVLHGVQRLGLPIPLGGTTLFFRREALERIGAWDAHNVTEDADLGMRLARFGYRCEMIPTTTLEEANAESLGRWVRQRSRWLKGYAITWATHMRRPGVLLRDLGWRGFLGFQVLFLGGMTSYLAMPLFWALWLGVAGFDLPVFAALPGGLMTAFFVSMFVGQAVMLAIATLALVDSGRARMLPWLATLPLYWPLGALAAYRALAEVFYAPFHWHKTEHGHDAGPPAPPERSVSGRGRRRAATGSRTPG